MATIQQLAKEISKAIIDGLKVDKTQNVFELLPSISLVPDINESLLKKPGDQIDMDPRTYGVAGSKMKIEAVSASSPPCFTVLHLLVIHWITETSPPNPSFYKRVNEIFSAVVQFGGDIDFPANGIKMPQSDLKDHYIRRPTSPKEFVLKEIQQDPNYYFDSSAGKIDLKPRISDLLKNIEIAKEANPFPRFAYSSSKSKASPWWSNLLLSEDFSDVIIACKDGTKYPAHQVVLSNASPYFKAYFTGPWSQQGKRDYETDIGSNIMKYILTYIYTSGSFGVSLAGIDVDGFCNILETGQFLQMEELVNSCCKFLKSKISLDSIKRITCTAYVMSTSTSTAATATSTATATKSLWDSCVSFFRANSVGLVWNSDFISLKDENPVLWNDLQQAILSSTSSSHQTSS